MFRAEGRRPGGLAHVSLAGHGQNSAAASRDGLYCRHDQHVWFPRSKCLNLKSLETLEI